MSQRCPLPPLVGPGAGCPGPRTGLVRLMGTEAPCCQGLLCGDGLDPRSARGRRGRPLLLLLPWPSTPCHPGPRRTDAVLPRVGAVAPGPDSTTPCAPHRGPDLPPAPAAPCRQAALVWVRDQGSEWGSVSSTGIDIRGGGCVSFSPPAYSWPSDPSPGTKRVLSKGPSLPPPQGLGPTALGPSTDGALWGAGSVVFRRPVPCPPCRDNCEARGNRGARPTPSNSSAV